MSLLIKILLLLLLLLLSYALRKRVTRLVKVQAIEADAYKLSYFLTETVDHTFYEFQMRQIQK